MAAIQEYSDNQLMRFTFTYILQAISSWKILTWKFYWSIGIFENHLKVFFTDPNMIKTTLACDWLSFGDEIECFSYVVDGFVLTLHNFLCIHIYFYWYNISNFIRSGHQVSVYFAAVAAAIHLLGSSDQKVQISWPNKVITLS